ncbi:hypothetical protein D3C72_2338970 [compost metagenome]
MPTPAEDRAIRQGIADDPDTMELGDDFFEKARPASEVLGASVVAALTARTKDQVTLRLDPDVLDALQSTGPGWQARVNALLREDIASGRLQGIT